MEDITSERLGSDMKNLCPTLWETLTGLVGNGEPAREAEEKGEKATREEKEPKEREA
ncbi:hypothetical protein FRC06_010813, partial [Ceratobasidium sp. 370]